MTPEAKKTPDLIAYQISTTGSGENTKSYYHRIGVAWNNSKGGAKVILHAFPVNGELLLMLPKERDEQSEAQPETQPNA